MIWGPSPCVWICLSFVKETQVNLFFRPVWLDMKKDCGAIILPLLLKTGSGGMAGSVTLYTAGRIATSVLS